MVQIYGIFRKLPNSEATFSHSITIGVLQLVHLFLIRLRLNKYGSFLELDKTTNSHNSMMLQLLVYVFTGVTTLAPFIPLHGNIGTLVKSWKVRSTLPLI